MEAKNNDIGERAEQTDYPPCPECGEGFLENGDCRSCGYCTSDANDCCEGKMNEKNLDVQSADMQQCANCSEFVPASEIDHYSADGQLRLFWCKGCHEFHNDRTWQMEAVRWCYECHGYNIVMKDQTCENCGSNL